MTTRFPFNISFKLLCLALFCGVLCCLAPSSRADGLVLPLDQRGFINMGWASLASVEYEAARQASGPPTGEPRFRSMMAPHYAVFEGDFKPHAVGTKLAIFADDGANVSRAEVLADGTLGNWSALISRLGVGQALPQLSQSFATMNETWVVGKTYRIRVEYKNIIYTLNTSDIDGLTLFAYDGGGTMSDSVINVEIEIYKTSADNDDLVRLGGSTLCRVRVQGNPSSDLTVVLSQTALTPTGGKLTFSGAETLTLTLAKSGAWSDDFLVNGVQGSESKDDIKIEARKNTAEGDLVGDEDASVFWVDDPNILISVGGYYGLTTANYTVTFGNGHAVDYAAWATIRPSALDGSAPQLVNLRIGIMQNLNSSERHHIRDTPTDFDWLTLDSPLTVMIYEQWDSGIALSGPFNDTNAYAAPLYDRPGIGQIDSRSLMIPFGLAGGGIARSYDTPRTPFPSTKTHYVQQGDKIVAAVEYTNRVKAILNDSFETWAVLFDTSTNEVTPLRQAHWELKVDSSKDSNITPQKANVTTPVGGTIVTIIPTEGPPYANNEGTRPENKVESFAGTATPHTR